MVPTREAFSDVAQAILRRFCAQNALELPAEVVLAEIGARLWAIVEERGLPRPLGIGETGQPGDLPDAECAPLVARMLDPLSDSQREKLAVPVRQLLKACFHPEFTVCRDSFREVSRDGTCRRQQLARVRGRVSGAHCIDCPHWVALTPEQHREFLAGEWQPAGRPELAEHLAIFLPEDFRALRCLLHAEARRRI